MIDKFNMVDMGGIDIVKSQGVEVNGLYSRLVEAMSVCRYQMLYNWYFAKVLIPPTAVELVLEENVVYINEDISVDTDDVVRVYSLDNAPVINQLTVVDNGTYSAPEGVDGFNPVSVTVSPNIIPLRCGENGLYTVPEEVDGYGPVIVQVTAHYSPVVPDFYGLATAYQALTGSFYTNPDKVQCLFIAHIEAGSNYVLFLPDQVGNRFRAAKWPGKTIADFTPYLDTPGSNTEIYTGGVLITPVSELQNEGLTRRFFFSGVDGEVVVGTSNNSQLVEPILLKINQ